MPEGEDACFVIMPFTPELHYFYLYLEQYLERRHSLTCERGDRRIQTRPFVEKINEQIARADVIIADCSGRNANVFYELGIAHALGKPVILMTSDPVEQAPSDVRHFEFIRYELDNHVDFLAKLDNALHEVFVGEYRELYRQAQMLFREFTDAMQVQARQATEQEFVARVRSAARIAEVPPTDAGAALRQFLLPKIVGEMDSFALSERVREWLSR